MKILKPRERILKLKGSVAIAPLALAEHQIMGCMVRGVSRVVCAGRANPVWASFVAYCSYEEKVSTVHTDGRILIYFDSSSNLMSTFTMYALVVVLFVIVHPQ